MTAKPEIKFVVACGSAGTAAWPVYDNEREAIERYEEEISIPSYMGPGHRRQASVYKITTITEQLR